MVSADGDRRRNDHSCGIDGLENALQMDLSCYFLNKNRGQSLRPQFLVYTKEVDLCRRYHTSDNRY